MTPRIPPPVPTRRNIDTMSVAPPTSRCKYPLHSAIRSTGLTEQSVIQTLREAYTSDPSSLSQVDDEGRTPIAVAAITANLPAVIALLEIAGEQTAEGDDLLGLQVTDKMSETAASHNLRILSENPRFQINNMLEKASRELRDGFIRNSLPPCICRKCTEGWFSPRMRFRLRETAKQTAESMRRNLLNFSDGIRLDGELVLTDPALPFLPIGILERGIYRPFYVGYRAAFQVVYDVLSRSSGSDMLPTVQRLRVELANGALDGRYDLGAVQFFAERGGSIRYALDYIIHRALWESPTPLGDGSFDAKWDDDVSSPFVTPMVGNPIICTNTAPASYIRIQFPILNDLKERPKRRSRSNSFKDALKTLSPRRSSLDTRRVTSIEPKMALSEAEKTELNRWKLKEEWDASGNPGCPLDSQFGGVRHLLGLHEEARWEFAVADVDAREKRPSCELRRV
ncbi:hypothetical protein NM688_g5758 [Phlebia brevispora]|uniref:Uncharacterized protein n=1 Tax=Phlebia brevispora TaxID=194682 RepID=A0ACC1SQC0_9APHY|nr:hypothetical protein NM688_g5758 [Phlebia brevispora]